MVDYEQESMTHMKAEGLLGMAFDTLSTFTHPPLFIQLLQQYPSLEPVFAFYLSALPNSAGSELHIGGYDEKRMQSTGSKWLMTRVIPQFGLYTFWRVAFTSVRIAGCHKLHDGAVICPSKASFNACIGFVDTGTSLLGIPSQLYLTFLYEITTYAQARGCYCGYTKNAYQCFLCTFHDFPRIEFQVLDSVSNQRHFFIIEGKDYTLCFD